jgi:hypothetical protein
MLINDLLGMLMQVPPVLAAQWGAWFVVGLILSIWGRREKMWIVVQPASTSRHNSGVHSPSPRPHAGAAARSAPVAAHSSGDAFAELEALLEQPTGGLHRTPGESSHLADAEPAEPTLLGAPQSLP